MLITEKILEDILNSYPTATTGIAAIAKRKTHKTRFIAQLNRMWDCLPSQIKNDKRHKNGILTTHVGNYRGKLAELYTHWTLRTTIPTGNIVVEPRINSLTTPQQLTPDFYLKSSECSFIIETFCLGQDLNERNYQKNLDELREEVKDLESQFIITTVGSPVPNQQGNFSGIKSALKTYLDGLSFDDDSEKIHSVDSNGATLYFHVNEKKSNALPTLFGHLGDIQSGDPQIELLTTRLEKKVTQYTFPFIASCVADSIGTADLFTLTETMLGREQFIIPVNIGQGAIEKDSAKLQYDNTGFWGIHNPALSSHLGVQGILFIRPEYPLGDGEVRLHVHFMENPHLKTGIYKTFQNVPEVLQTPFDGDRMDLPGLVITP